MRAVPSFPVFQFSPPRFGAAWEGRPAGLASNRTIHFLPVAKNALRLPHRLVMVGVQAASLDAALQNEAALVVIEDRAMRISNY